MTESLLVCYRNKCGNKLKRVGRTNRCYGHHIFINWPLWEYLSVSLSCPPIFWALVVIDIARHVCCKIHVLEDRRRWSIVRLIISWHRKTWRESRGWLSLRPVHVTGGRGSPCRKRILCDITLVVTATRAQVSFWWSLLLILSWGTGRIATAAIFRQIIVYLCELLTKYVMNKTIVLAAQ
jgi:hypothetical protein